MSIAGVPRADAAPLLPTAGAGPVKLLILQATPFCNINCRYCYLPNRDDKARMSLATVQKTVERLVLENLVRGTLLVNWHAGEPLVLSPGFYDERIPLFAPLSAAGVDVCHSLQTNGTLIDDAFCDLFLRHDIKVGVSIDGPAFIHDQQRQTRSGKSTHEKTVKGIRALQRHRVDFNVICVLSDLSVRHPDEIYAFFRELGTRAVAFNIEEIEGANRSSSILNRGFEDRFRRFIERFWELTERDGRSMRVREFDDAEGRVLDQMPRRNSQTDPLVNLTVATDGSFTTFCPELLGNSFPTYPTFTLGNVHEIGLREALQTELARRMDTEIRAGVAACRAQCDYFSVCGGGNPSNKISENGSFASTTTRNCRNRIMTVCDFVLGKLEQRLAASAGSVTR